MRNICILEHPRSGGNYLHMLLSKNFFGETWVKFDASHEVLTDLNTGVKYIYLFRNTYNTLRSVYKIREMFCIDIDSFGKFLNTKYSEMYNGKSKKREVPLILNRGKVIYAKDNDRSRPFKSVNMTPIRYHEYHVSFYQRLEKFHNNIITISYERLVHNFLDEMKRISEFLNIFPINGEFTNIKMKVGYYLENNQEIHEVTK